MRFRTTVHLAGKTATGLPVPDEVVASLGRGKRVPVVISIGDYSYRTTVTPMGGQFFVPLAAEHRTAAGVEAGQQIDVGIELDDQPRVVAVPDDLAELLDERARAFFDGLAFTHQREWVQWIESAKKPETRASRLAKTAEALREGRRGR